MNDVLIGFIARWLEQLTPDPHTPASWEIDTTLEWLAKNTQRKKYFLGNVRKDA